MLEADMPNDSLDTRWQKLVTLTEEQFLEHRQHPGGGVFKSDRGTLKLSGILKDGGYFSVTLTSDQVLKGDLRGTGALDARPPSPQNHHPVAGSRGANGGAKRLIAHHRGPTRS
jgi:hypothetical protein